MGGWQKVWEVALSDLGLNSVSSLSLLLTLDKVVNLPKQNEGPEDPLRVGVSWSAVRLSAEERLFRGCSIAVFLPHFKSSS